MNATRGDLPTFLGIGSMRCGSTWLYEALQRRPDVQMSSPKQLQFFNKLMLKHDLEWYRKHFRTPNGQPPAPVRGEITPFYARLSDASVQRIQRLLPDARIVLTIRNPMDRIWSHILYDWGVCKKKDLSRIGAMPLLDFVRRQRAVRYTDYESILRRWRRYFGNAAVRVDLFDRLKSDHRGFLRDVLVHIGADPDQPESEGSDAAGKPVYAARDLLKRDLAPPAIVRWAIAVEWLPKTRRLNEYLDGSVSHWVEEMEAVASQGRPSWRTMRNASRFVTSLPERVAYAAYDLKTERALSQRWNSILQEAALSDG